MFHTIEKHRNLAQVIMGLIGISFMAFGVAGYQTAADNNFIVKIGDEPITRFDLDNAVRNVEASGGQADRNAVFKSLVQRAYLLEGAKQMGIVISDDQIKQIVVDTPQFHGADGKFDPTLFQQYLENIHLTEKAFMEEQRRNMQTMTVLRMLNNNVAADSQAMQILRATIAPRTIRTSEVNLAQFVSQVKISDAELKKFYEANKKNYLQQQGVKFEYVTLSSKDLAAKQSVTDEEVKKAFDENQSSLKAKRTIAHILIAAPKSADAATRAKAKEQAEKVAAEAKANPAQFAELAKKYSQDVGSAANGGELGSFAQDGSVGSKAVEDAAFALEKGAVSGVVESDYGYHIVRVTDIAGADFESQKETLRQSLQEKKAQAALNALRENFAQEAFNSPGALKPAADKLGVTLNTQSEWLTKVNADSLKVPKPVVDALFSDEVFAKKHNSEAINVNGVIWFVRATETRPESTLPFEQVKAQVQDEFVKSESMRLAKEYAAKLVADLQAGKSLTMAWSPAQEVVPTQARATLPENVYAALMKANPKGGKAAYIVAEMLNTPSIVEVQTIKTPENNPEALASAKQVLAQMQGDALVEDYVQMLQKSIPTKQGAEQVSDGE
ncbi:SurA N-terminal domain-containing protein [Kingella negevensis]|uniref:SurA N-terminal domain-containing protein n=1 Tax=Kingella negevensis TaxID=1522312 RepID=UPI00254282D6|nr:SurA N-terminal domain-containing protein [Kingella negevensis]WII92927.1 SurA N-terminal domain-containing protein [Kingella negevensis]